MNKTTKRIIKIGVFIGATVGTMYAINRYIEKAVSLIDKLKVKEDSYYKWRHGNIYYEKQGEGTPILLIHDYTPYASSFEWKNVVDSLSDSHTVYTIDLLGCGRSDKPAITYTNFMYVQLITDFINEVIGEKTDIITSGHASSIALMSSNYTCEYINKLLLINPAHLISVTSVSSALAKVTKTFLEIPILGTFIYNMFTLRKNIKSILTEKYVYNSFDVDDDMIDSYYKAAHYNKASGRYVLSSIIANYMDANVPHALNICTNETFIIGGNLEENIEDIIDDYKKIKPEIASAIITGSKKLPHYEAAEEVIEKIKEFVDQNQ